MATTKVTKKDYFEALKAMVDGVDTVGEYPAADVIDFIDKQIAQIENKAAKAKERAAAKRAEGDELRATIKGVLTDEFQTADDITKAIGDEDITKAKVVARLSQLVAVGEAVKEPAKVGDRKLMTYKLA